MTLCSRVVSTFNILFLTYQQMPLHHYMHRMQSFYTPHSATLRCISPSIAWFTSHTQVLLVACRHPLHSTCYCSSHIHFTQHYTATSISPPLLHSPSIKLVACNRYPLHLLLCCFSFITHTITQSL